MAEDTPAVPPPSPKKTVSKAAPKPKKASVAKPVEHPPYRQMVIAALVALKNRKGSSRQGIVKYIKNTYKGVGDNGAKFIKQALIALLRDGTVVSVKGQGASGSFKLAKVEKPKTVVKKPAAKPKAKSTKAKAPKTKKAAAKKVKKPSAKKAAAAAKKPAAAKKTAAKKTVAKKAAVKKPKAKKAAKSPAKKGKSPAKKAAKSKAKAKPTKK